MTTIIDAGNGHSSSGSEIGNGNSSSGSEMTTAPVDCPSTIDEPNQRPYLELFSPGDDPILRDDPVVGEPGCEGPCGYVVVFDLESEFGDDLIWQHDPALSCPLALNECDELESALDENPARCNTVADCTSFQAELNPCEPHYGPVHYFDSALFTSQQRRVREEILSQLEQRGCRDARPQDWDGPLYSLACEHNLCQLVVDGDCLLGREWEPADGGTLDAGN